MNQLIYFILKKLKDLVKFQFVCLISIFLSSSSLEGIKEKDSCSRILYSCSRERV